MFVCDDVLADPAAYRADVLARPFNDIVIGPDVFHGIQIAEDETFPAWIVGRWPHLTPTFSFFRQSPRGQREPNYVHHDASMGQWTALLYLTPHPPEGDGTTFWRHKASGAISVRPGLGLDAPEAWRDRAQWEPAGQIGAKFGRAVVFDAERFHSRAMSENYGTGDDARLVQVVFGLGTL